MTKPKWALKEDYNSYMRGYLKEHYAKNKEMHQLKQKKWLLKNPVYYREYYLAHKNLKK